MYLYSVFKVGRTTNFVQRLLKRVHVRLPQQISAFHTKPPVFQTNRCPSSKWTLYDTRSLSTGVHFCSKNDGQKDTDQVSVSRSSHTPPSASAAQKGNVMCSSDNYHSDHSFRTNAIVLSPATGTRKSNETAVKLLFTIRFAFLNIS